MFSLHHDIVEQNAKHDALIQQKDMDEEDEYALELLSEIEIPKANLILSTYGGSVHDMFALYDAVQMLKSVTDVATIGMGKVMSAGVLLLASGTKGERKMGRHCSQMVHPFQYHFSGNSQDGIVERKETERQQKKYVSLLAEMTNLEEKDIQKMFKKQNNTYMSAEEAKQYGIVDEIIG